MAQIKDFANLTIGLSATPPSTASFGVGILMCDTDDVAVDQKYKIVTNETYTSTLTSGTDEYSWCQSVWGQNQNAELERHKKNLVNMELFLLQYIHYIVYSLLFI